MSDRVILAKELPAVGCTCDPDEFNDSIQEVFKVIYPSWTIDALLKRPTSAIEYCRAVRNRVRCEAIPDHVVLGALLNLRKRGVLD